MHLLNKTTGCCKYCTGQFQEKLLWKTRQAQIFKKKQGYNNNRVIEMKSRFFCYKITLVFRTMCRTYSGCSIYNKNIFDITFSLLQADLVRN